MENFRNIPTATQIFVGVSALLSLIGKFLINDDGVVPYFAMLPGYALPPNYFLWTLVTCGFFETSIINAVLNILIFIIFGKYLENVWGSREFVQFVLIVQFFTSLSLLVILIFLYAFSKSIAFLYGVDIHGMAAILGGFLVVFKQLVPEHRLEAGPISIRAKDGPMLSILVFLIFFFLGWTRFSEVLCCLAGIFTSWIYLRFFQKNGNKKGDRSETFQFATFFPEKLRPLALVISTIAFRTLVLLRACERVAPQEGEEEQLTSFRIPPPNFSLIGGDPSDAERRRNLAAAALEARLAQKPSQEREKSQAESILQMEEIGTLEKTGEDEVIN